MYGGQRRRLLLFSCIGTMGILLLALLLRRRQVSVRSISDIMSSAPAPPFHALAISQDHTHVMSTTAVVANTAHNQFDRQPSGDMAGMLLDNARPGGNTSAGSIGRRPSEGSPAHVVDAQSSSTGGSLVLSLPLPSRHKIAKTADFAPGHHSRLKATAQNTSGVTLARTTPKDSKRRPRGVGEQDGSMAPSVASAKARARLPLSSLSAPPQLRLPLPLPSSVVTRERTTPSPPPSSSLSSLATVTRLGARHHNSALPDMLQLSFTDDLNGLGQHVVQWKRPSIECSGTSLSCFFAALLAAGYNIWLAALSYRSVASPCRWESRRSQGCV